VFALSRGRDEPRARPTKREGPPCAEARTEAYEKSSLAGAPLGNDATGINCSDGRERGSDLSSFLHKSLHKTRRH